MKQYFELCMNGKNVARLRDDCISCCEFRGDFHLAKSKRNAKVDLSFHKMIKPFQVIELFPYHWSNPDS